MTDPTSHRIALYERYKKEIGVLLTSHAFSLPRQPKFSELRRHVLGYAKHFAEAIPSPENIIRLCSQADHQLLEAIRQQQLHIGRTTPIAGRISNFRHHAININLF